MTETSQQPLRDQLQEERDRVREQLANLGHRDDSRASTSTRTSPTPARSPPSGARSRRCRVSSRESAPGRSRTPWPSFDAGTYGECESAASGSPRPGSRRCPRPGSASAARRKGATRLTRCTLRAHRRADVHLLRLPGRRGHPARDQPRRGRAVVRRRTAKEAGRLTLNPLPAHRPVRLDRAPGDGRDRRGSRCSATPSRCR